MRRMPKFRIGTVVLFSSVVLAACSEANVDVKPPAADLTAGKDAPWATEVLLPNDTKPIHYDLFLDPCIEEGVFYGRVAITIETKAPRDHLIVHVKYLNVTSTQLFLPDQSAISVKKAFEYEPNEFWVIQVEYTLPAGKYLLKLDFNGSLTKSIVGFYRSSYSKTDGTTRYLASTKFEPTYARRAFPCFDEPSFKATFDIKLVRPAKDDYFALSNMHQISEEADYPKKGKVTAKFATTPPMATYLACFIVCDFEKLPSVKTESGTVVTLYARQGQANNTVLARDVTVAVLEHFTDYFKIKFPLSKLDLIAIPDFVSGAMENWGLITFRETQLLANNDKSAFDMISVMTTVAHELAHMWFGDLVTMSWWDDLWLNEGFATFLATRVLTKLYPQYQAESSGMAAVYNVLVDDAAVSSHPIIQQVRHPDQITEIFDVISYAKGSAVLRMMEDFDPKGFQNAVCHYLEEFQYKNAHTSDLWAHLAVEMREVEDLPRMLDTWTKQMGYPLVFVESIKGNLVFEQTRCLTNAKAEFQKDSSFFKYKWDIPIKYITSRNASTPQSTILKLDQKHLKLPLKEGVEWFKINAKQVGFYRVMYTETEWMNLKNHLYDNPNIMSPEDRANLIDDAFSLAKSGYLCYGIPFQFISYLKSGKENHWLPWYVVYRHTLNLLLPLRHSGGTSTNLKTYIGNLIGSVYSNDIWNLSGNSPITEKLFKSSVASLVCHIELPAALKKVNELFSDWITGGSKPPIDVRKTIYTFGMYGDKLLSNWEELWDLYLVEQDPLEKNMMIVALAKVTEPKLLTRLLENMKNESLVRSQDYFSFMFVMLSTPQGNTAVWDYVKNNWDYLVKRFTLNDRSLGRLLPEIATQFHDQNSLDELNQFIALHPEAGAGAAGRKRAVEKARWNIIWGEQYLPVLEEALSKLVSLRT
ncbi:glutamyl aminopeptidase-like isoform X2 [Cimex lectularius]|uniref:Aminopeptidase n=1 Tax=Cimex lectularius TaxID=79782 RepID=A0A8I6RKF6_CIMLE|nr:glutamyl aminopeptidase-like isoform X2 [Cimex lectularius]XP_014246648.1 glutamyl aminopeptidase-like isoform X2 [Cimex lectularius]